MKSELSELTKAALSGVMPVLVLRGTDDLARDGGDLDFMVPPGCALQACDLLTKTAKAYGWLLVGFRDIGYLAQVVLIRHCASGNDDVLKIDFFDGLRWYGVGKDTWANRLFGMLQQSPSDETRLAGVASFFQKLLTVGQLSQRDWTRVLLTGADVDYLLGVAGRLQVPLTRRQLEMHGVGGLAKWRVRAASGGVSGPISAFTWILQVSLHHFRVKLGFGETAGLLLGVSGPDGSGKSTLVDRLLVAWRKGGSINPKLVHLLPSWIPLPHQIYRRKKTQANYDKPYSEPPVRFWLSGRLRLAFYLIVFTIARLQLWIAVKRGHLIVLDRSFLDFSSDLTRSRIPARRLPDWVIRALVPARLLFYLDASPATVVARKGELSLEKAKSLQASYRDICTTVGAIILDGDAAADAVFVSVLEHLAGEHSERIELAKGRSAKVRAK